MNNIENLKDLIIYQSQNNENISVEVLYNEEDFWLTQKSMAKLFNVVENNITYYPIYMIMFIHSNFKINDKVSLNLDDIQI